MKLTVLKLHLRWSCSESRGVKEKTLSSTMLSLDQSGADLHLFQTRFVIGWENNKNGYKTMPLSLKTIGSAGYRRIFADLIDYIFPY